MDGLIRTILLKLMNINGGWLRNPAPKGWLKPYSAINHLSIGAGFIQFLPSTVC